MAEGYKTGGRAKGTPNKSTAAVREAIAVFAEANASRMSEWLDAVAASDPAKAFDLYLRALEFHIPKQARLEHRAEDATPIVRDNAERAARIVSILARANAGAPSP